MKTKSKKIFGFATLFVAIFSISTPAVMYFSTGAVSLNLLVDGFWMLGLFQSVVLTIVANYIFESRSPNEECVLHNIETFDNLGYTCDHQEGEVDSANEVHNSNENFDHQSAKNSEDWDNDMLNNPAYSWSMFNNFNSD
ncbi:TPA: protein Exp2 [Neisseria subflava]